MYYGANHGNPQTYNRANHGRAQKSVDLEQLCEKLAVLQSLTQSKRYKPPFCQQVGTSPTAKSLKSTSNTWMTKKLKHYCAIFLPLQYQQFCSNYHGSNGIRLQERPFHWLIMHEKFFPREKKDSELIQSLCIWTIFSLTTWKHKLPLRTSWPRHYTYWIFVVLLGHVCVLFLLDLVETTKTGRTQSLHPIIDFAPTNQKIVNLNSWLTE